MMVMELVVYQNDCEHSLMPCSNQGCGLLTSLEEPTYLLHATLVPRCAGKFIRKTNISIENQQSRRKYSNFDRRKGKKDGGKEGGRQEERNKGLAPKCCVHLPIYTCYFQRVASPTQFTRSVASTVQFTDFSRNTLQTACHYLQCMDNSFNMPQVPCHLQL